MRLTAADTKACLTQLVWIENAIVQGPDIIAAMAASQPRTVRLRDSVVENGLYFDDLPSAKVSALAESLRSQLRASTGYDANETVHLVDAVIELHNTRILAGAAYDGDEYAAIALSASRTVFARELNLLGTRIEGSARFSRASFLGHAVFKGAQFVRRVTFDAAGFASGGEFDDASFQGSTLFTYARFGGNADFQHTRFDRSPMFDKARICGDANFGETFFAEGLRFVDTRVAARMTFLDADFPKGADFASAQFDGTLQLPRIHGTGILTFARSQIRALEIGSPDYRSRIDTELDFSDVMVNTATVNEVRFDGPVTFARAHIRPAEFMTDVYTRMRGGAPPEPRMQRSAARLPCSVRATATTDGQPDDQAVTLRGVEFHDRVSFERAVIGGRARFAGVTFPGGANFSAIVFAPPKGSKYLPFSRLSFENVDIDWSSVAPFTRLEPAPDDVAEPEPTSALLENLEKRYAERGRLADVLHARRAKRWASVREAWACLWGKITRAAAANRAMCDGVDAVLASAVLPVWGVSSGFGTSLLRLLIVITVTIVAFALVYWLRATLMRSAPPAGKDPPGMRLHPMALPSEFVVDHSGALQWTPHNGFTQALALSTHVLLRFGDSSLAAEPRTPGARLKPFILAEWCLGIPLLIDLVYTLSETQPFLQKLVTGTIG